MCAADALGDLRVARLLRMAGLRGQLLLARLHLLQKRAEIRDMPVVGRAGVAGFCQPRCLRHSYARAKGHYLAHRHLLPDGIECDDKVVIQRAGIGIEKEADEFAAYLLMPFDDFRNRVSSTDKPGIDELSACAERYGVSLVAAIMRWLEYTERRAILVVPRDGGAIWSKASDAACGSVRPLTPNRRPSLTPTQRALSVESHSAF